MSAKNNGDGTETIKVDGKGQKRARAEAANTCACMTFIEIKASDPKVALVKKCTSPCRNTFAQGHDARMVSTLQKAFRGGATTLAVAGKANDKTTVAAQAKALGFTHHLTEAPARAPRARKATAKKATKAAKAAKAAKKAPAVKGPTHKGSMAVGTTVTTKYRNAAVEGRVTKIGMGDDVEVSFQTKSGNDVKKVFASGELTIVA
jgi:nucleoid-associated protein YgaU